MNECARSTWRGAPMQTRHLFPARCRGPGPGALPSSRPHFWCLPEKGHPSSGRSALCTSRAGGNSCQEGLLCSALTFLAFFFLTHQTKVTHSIVLGLHWEPSGKVVFQAFQSKGEIIAPRWPQHTLLLLIIFFFF